ncbi:MAG: DUF4040 domain-containing protein [Blautia sp.]|nr:DUF4040 domain-containing protein [Blautia sp.]
MTGTFRVILLILLIICAIAVNLTGNLIQAVVIFMSYSSIMCIIWILMESPDLAITEAAVGAGISGTLFLMTLRKIRTETSKEEFLPNPVEGPDREEEERYETRSMDGEELRPEILPEEPGQQPEEEK